MPTREHGLPEAGPFVWENQILALIDSSFTTKKLTNMGPISMTDSCKVNEKALLPQLFKSGLFFKVLCKRKVFNLICVNEEHQRETYCEGDQGTDVVEIIPARFKFVALLA